jgi:hypothetical protein
MRIPRGTIRATVLIETILASFEMVGGTRGAAPGGRSPADAARSTPLG